MEFAIDLSVFSNFSQLGPLSMVWIVFINGGWIVFVWFFINACYLVWLFRKQNQWFATNEYMILAVDIPKDTEQTPKAVEQLFATISGAHTPLSYKELWWQGKFQLAFQFEIISIDGYIQFLIRTPRQWRDLVESAIYSQYPDAEITEVEDYVNTVPDKYPNDTHNIWGTEVILARNDVFPIKTYKEFEDSVSGEFKDPLASLLETMSKIKKGEQVWIQIIVKPTGFEWTAKSSKMAYKIAGKKVPEKKNGWSSWLSPFTGLIFLTTGEEMFFQTGGGSKPSVQKEPMPSMMLHLTPGERLGVEAIERKASKIGFECKIRLIYISPLELFQSSRVVSSVFGSLKQFNTLDLNAFKPDPRTKTQIMYFFIKSRIAARRRYIMEGYKKRSGMMGHSPFILNTEELATLWHFPARDIKAPLLQKTESKKSEPPSSLPIESMEKTRQTDYSELRRQLRESTKPDQPAFDLMDKHYEHRFAKKNALSTQRPASTTHKGEPPANLPLG
ncbi:MAG: hypothetical protein C3F02_04460 [Parcubacteria group bacterium]|nr:MAG: hypothetical protein C3F02_04460 [Parcubacteria group bacterium]